MPPSYGGPALPRNLLDQVGGGQTRNRGTNTRGGRGNSRGRGGARGGRPTAPATRKDKRKLEREQKRQPRHNGPTRQPQGRSEQGLRVHKVEDDDELSEDGSDDVEEQEIVKPKTPVAAVPRTAASSKASKPAPPRQDSKSGKQDTEIQAPRNNKRVQEKLAQDDAEIAALERKLGMKGKKLGKSFQDEGLAELLGDLDDGDGEEAIGGKRKSAADREWLDRKRRKVAPGIVEEEEVEEEESEDDASEEDGAMNEGLERDDDDDSELYEATDDEGYDGDLMTFDDGDVVDIDMDAEPPDDSDSDLDSGEEAKTSRNKRKKTSEGLEVGSFSGFDSEDEVDDGDDGHEDEDEDEDEQVLPKPARENPYIAPGTNNEKPSGKYIPPSLRAAASGDAELTNRLKRQVQGLLNRLSEANIISILSDIEQLYQNNPRQYVTSTLIDLLLGLVCDRTTLNDTFLILHAGFIAAVYKVIGPDFGAQFLERLVESFDKAYKDEEQDEAGRKECTNLMSLLAQLYNLQVIGAELVFDYIRGFLDNLTELHTELLLRVVRTSGYQLRQDDPSALKDIVLSLQRTASTTGHENLSVRTKFMIDTINDLKNNKLKAGVAASAVTSEHLTRMRKALGTLNNRNIKVTEPMRIGLNDIRDTNKRGKWWLVGASWKGRDQDAEVSKPSSKQLSSRLADDVEDDNEEEVGGTTDLLVLARNARMNTDIRRAVFVTIMSATDYKDAHLKLVKLNLTRAQEVEIPRVLLHCAGAEKQYNPYYTLIARKLCGEHKQRMAFQFSLWDFFKRLGERGPDDDAVSEDEDEDEESGSTSMAVIVNYAKLFAQLIGTGGLGLNVLKHLDLVYLQAKTRVFLEILLVTILLQTETKASAAKKRSSTTALPLRTILATASAHPQIVTGLQWFLRKVVAKTDLAKDAREKDLLKSRCKEAVSVLITAGQGGGAEDEE